MGADASLRNIIAMATIGLSLAACSGSSPHRGSEAGGFGKTRGYYKVGAPYQVGGVWYYPRVDFSYDETGTASWYGEAFNGKSTANGETFDLNEATAAHKTLQLPSVVEVTNLQNGRALKVRVNDRGPFAGDRIIDLSRRAAQLLGFERAGTAPVRVKIVKEESIRVAEAAMRGDIGQTRLAQEPRQTETRIATAASHPSIRAAPPSTGVVEVAAVDPVAVRRAPAPIVAPELARARPLEPALAVLSPQPVEPPPVASEQAAHRVEHAVARAPAWPSLIASAHAATTLAPLPTRDGQSSRIFVQAGMFAVAENAQRVRTRFAGLTGTEVVRVTVNGNPLYRVRLGPLASEAEARRLVGKLAESGISDARVVGD